MSKPKRERSLADNEARAVLRNLRTSPYKLNLVAEMIRGKKVAEALTQLTFSNKRIAGDVKNSAVGDRQRGKQSQPKRGCAGGERGLGWQSLHHEAFSRPRSWPRRQDFETPFAPDHCGA